MKVENLINYQVFELRRQKDKDEGGKGLEGGGIAVGALHELKPVLTREGDDDAECLSIEIKVANQKFLCVTGYGPQLSDSADRKTKFWNYLEEEVKSADDRDIGIIIQIDSNSWVGEDIIPNDPNKQNSNGKLVKEFLERNVALSVVNSLSLCKGSITRQRTTTRGQEKFILNLFIVCRRVVGLIKHMEIDHLGKYKLTSFRPNKAVPTDHNSMTLVLDLSVPIMKPDRTSNFDFRNTEGQIKFFHVTNDNTKLSSVFSTDKTFKLQTKEWEKIC